MRSIGLVPTALAAVALLGVVFVGAGVPADRGSDLDRTSERVEAMSAQLEALNARVDSARRQLAIMEFRDLPTSLDFTTPDVQEISPSFALVRSGMEAHLSGVKVTGRIINLDAVDYVGVEFRLEVFGADESRLFSISRISSGNSTAFEVFIPNIAPTEARFGRVTYVSSQVSYLAG